MFSIRLANKYLQINLVWFLSLLQRESLEWLNLLRSDSLKPAVTLLLPLLHAHGTLTEYIISANNDEPYPLWQKSLSESQFSCHRYINKIAICSDTQLYSLKKKYAIHCLFNKVWTCELHQFSQLIKVFLLCVSYRTWHIPTKLEKGSSHVEGPLVV